MCLEWFDRKFVCIASMEVWGYQLALDLVLKSNLVSEWIIPNCQGCGYLVDSHVNIDSIDIVVYVVPRERRRTVNPKRG